LTCLKAAIDHGRARVDRVNSPTIPTASVATGPKAGGGDTEFTATQRPFASCGILIRQLAWNGLTQYGDHWK
jgi:hypothetical protein